MSTIEAHNILTEAPNIVAIAIRRGYARLRLSDEMRTGVYAPKGIRTFTPEHRAKLRAARLKVCQAKKEGK